MKAAVQLVFRLRSFPLIRGQEWEIAFWTKPLQDIFFLKWHEHLHAGALVDLCQPNAESKCTTIKKASIKVTCEQLT